METVRGKYPVVAPEARRPGRGAVVECGRIGNGRRRRVDRRAREWPRSVRPSAPCVTAYTPAHRRYSLLEGSLVISKVVR
jgi:hypothetical protein